MEVTSATSTPTQGQAQKAGASLADDFQTFLTLLTTQLQFQDPLDPMDSNQFTQQLVSFTGVEQQIAANKNLETLIAQLQSQTTANAVAYIGKDVIINTSAAKLREDGARWTYSLDLMSDETILKVKDAAGNVVFETTGKNQAGNHEFKWDGRDRNGVQLPEGIYSLEVKALTADDQEIATQVFMRGRVEGLEKVNGENYLLVNDLLFPMDYVASIKEPGSSDDDGGEAELALIQ